MALLTYARDADSHRVYFAIVADDTGAEYVWPPFEGSEWFDGEDRLSWMIGENEPTTALEWLEAASHNLGLTTAIDEPIEFPNVEDAQAEAERALAGVTPPEDTPGVLESARAAFDQVSQDYPGFGEERGDDSDEDDDPQATLNFVLMTLGPIDPDGPNGWILRAVEGNPRPGDENEYIHWPGVDPRYDVPQEVETE